MRLDQRKVGVLLSYLGEAVKIVTALVYTPLMLQLLGQSEYGLYELVSSTVAYLSLLSLGFSSAYVRYHSRYQVNNDEQGIARLNGMFMIVFCVMSLLCLVCGGVMVWQSDLLLGENLTSQELDKAKVLMAILVVSMAITFPNSVFACYVTAHEKFIFQKLLNLLQHLLNPFITLPLLLMGYDSVAVVAVSALLTVLVFVSNFVFCMKWLKMRFAFSGLQLSLLKELSGFTFFIFLNQIIDQANWSVDKFLLGRLSGTAAVAVYGIGGRINSLHLQTSTAVSNVFIPQVNKIVARTDDNLQLTHLMVKVGRVQLVIIGLVMTGFAFLGKAFIRLWAGEGYGDSYWVAVLMMLPVTVPLIQNLGIEIQRAKNMHRARSVVYASLAVLNVILSIFLIRFWGCVGAAIGTSVSLILGNIVFMNWYYHKKIGLDMILFWKEIAKFVPALLVVCLFGIIYINVVKIDGWGILFGSALCFTAVYAAAMWFLGLNDYEKQLVRNITTKLRGVR